MEPHCLALIRGRTYLMWHWEAPVANSCGVLSVKEESYFVNIVLGVGVGVGGLILLYDLCIHFFIFIFLAY